MYVCMYVLHTSESVTISAGELQHLTRVTFWVNLVKLKNKVTVVAIIAQVP
jgi:hypothetical protein